MVGGLLEASFDKQAGCFLAHSKAKGFNDLVCEQSPTGVQIILIAIVLYSITFLPPTDLEPGKITPKVRVADHG